MTKLILLASISFAGVIAHAQRMPYAPRMTCAQARHLVATEGAVVLRTGEFTYDRYVSNFGECSNAGDETTRPAWIATRDNPQCFVGYTCSQDNRGGNGG